MKVKFLPMNVELEVATNQSVMELAHQNNIPIASVCNGMPSCAECRVRLVDGEHNVLPPSVKELSLIGTGHFIDQRRLSCQLICFGDITVDLAEQVEKAAEGKVNKKFLQKAQKSAGDSHAAEGVFIETDQDFKNISTTDNTSEADEEVAARSSGGGSSDSREPTKKNQDGRPQGQNPGGGGGRGRNRRGGRNRNRNRKNKS